MIAASMAAAPVPVTATVRGSLEATLSRVDANHGPALAAQVARLLRWRGDVARHLHPDDRLWLLYEPPASSDAQPELMALLYEGKQIQLSAYHYIAEAGGVPRFFDSEGVSVAPVLLQSPVANYVQITEGMQRGRGKRKHAGLDLKAEEGEPVRLPWAATVRRVNWHTRINGLCVEVTYSASGRLARFLHLSSVAAAVRPGAVLPAGAVIGAVGNTGRSSAAHLHYEILEPSGRHADPLKVHSTQRARLTDAALADFQAVRQHYDRTMRTRTLARSGAAAE